ncbi:MAG TPA: hypothetical protein VKT70_06285 [Stellaceae bacterium]|nr:hypothetical protein [Stellaceae bacterium]
MPLKIETFNNSRGGNTVFKALSHPLAARAAPTLLARLKGGKVALYDPEGIAAGFAELYDVNGIDLRGVFVQDLAAVGSPVLGRAAEPVSALSRSDADLVFIATFDTERVIREIRHLVPPRADLLTLDGLRLPPALLTNPRRYLDPLNFATNFVFFRDGDGLSTRLTSANYWAGYGAGAVRLWALLFDEIGRALAEWEEKLSEGIGTFVLDSREIRRRFGLPPFTGQIFLQVIGAAGHDVVKYALDIIGPQTLSSTHDANSWPADFYAGLPAPAMGEKVVLWVQNSQPCPIPAGAIGLNLMGDAAAASLTTVIPPYASLALDVGALLPAAAWPQQIEVRAGKYMVRPRYEVVTKERRRIAHVNVERTDLKADPRLPELGPALGKGFLLPAPLLPRARWQSLVLPTPMATTQDELPIALLVYDAEGREAARRRFDPLPRRHETAIDLDEILDGRSLEPGYGHFELTYDLESGGSGDGWLHALFRYRDRDSGHAAESSFGAHVFNTVMTYRDEPQSYSARPPGLSTRLFLRLNAAPHDTLCHLIYPASLPWHAKSTTDLILQNSAGQEVARTRVEIPCSGSRFWRYHEMFEESVRARAGGNAHIIVRDTTCRLFGYHGLLGGGGAFSLDHMFGF